MSLMTDKYSNKEIAHLLKSVAGAYLLKKKNRFKIIAYENAADAVEHLTREVRDLWQEDKLKEVTGIGPAIASHLDEYFKTGKSSHFEKVFQGIPQSVFVLLRVSTLGPKRAYKLVKSLNLINEKTVIIDLKNACNAGKVAQIERFGEKSQQEILEALGQFERQTSKRSRMPLPYAFNIAEEIIAYLKKHPSVSEVNALGSLRRMVTTIGDIDIAVKVPSSYRSAGLRGASTSYKDIINYFAKFPKKVKIVNAGERKASVIIRPDVQIDLRVQEAKSYGSMLQYFTGSKDHNIKLREYALKKGYSLSEYGIKKFKDPHFVPALSRDFVRGKQSSKLYEFEKETELYQFLDLQYIPSEIREGTNEIELAAKNQIPNLVELKDIKGDLHVHSSYDLKPSHDLGIDTIENVIKTSKEMGYQYVGFADHNPSISSTSQEEIIRILKARYQYFDKLISLKKIVRSDYFIGLEVDIRPNGQLALPEKAVAYLDYIIASVHSSFDMDKATMTKRILKSLDYPKVKILGHPTGRLLDRREGYELEWEKIFNKCFEKKIALEVNAWPDRLDLPDMLVREAINHGVKLMINTDAHKINQMKNIFYGVAVGRRGWAKKNDIINTLDYKEIRKWLLDLPAGRQEIEVS